MFHAIALDRRLDLPSLESGLDLQVTHRSTQRLMLEVDEGTAWLFAWGAFVYQARERNLELERRLAAWTATDLEEETYEDLTVHLGEADGPRVDWRAVWLPSAGEEIDDVLALLLARSVGLDRYERRANPLLQEGAQTLHAFARGGRTPWAVAELVRRLARSTESRIELAQWFVHLDRPEATWNDPVADKLYGLLSDHLELRERQQLLTHQMTVVEDGLSRVLGVWEGRHARGLEWAILLLILVEVIMAFLH